MASESALTVLSTVGSCEIVCIGGGAVANTSAAMLRAAPAAAKIAMLAVAAVCDGVVVGVVVNRRELNGLSTQALSASHTLTPCIWRSAVPLSDLAVSNGRRGSG